jgi:hypothetical protein
VISISHSFLFAGPIMTLSLALIKSAILTIPPSRDRYMSTKSLTFAALAISLVIALRRRTRADNIVKLPPGIYEAHGPLVVGDVILVGSNDDRDQKVTLGIFSLNFVFQCPLGRFNNPGDFGRSPGLYLLLTLAWPG